MIKVILAISIVASSAAYGAVEWRALEEENHLGGRKASSGYLQGKVVLVDRWGARCPPCRRKLPRMCPALKLPLLFRLQLSEQG